MAVHPKAKQAVSQDLTQMQLARQERIKRDRAEAAKQDERDRWQRHIRSLLAVADQGVLQLAQPSTDDFPSTDVGYDAFVIACERWAKECQAVLNAASNGKYYANEDWKKAGRLMLTARRKVA